MDNHAIVDCYFWGFYGVFLFRLFQQFNPLQELYGFLSGLMGLLATAVVFRLLAKYPGSVTGEYQSFLPIIWSAYSVSLLFDGFILMRRTGRERPQIYAGISVFSVTASILLIAHLGLHWKFCIPLLIVAAVAGTLASHSIFLNKTLIGKARTVVLLVLFILMLAMLI